MKRLKLKKIILFESNPDFSDNTYALFRYMSNNTNILDNYKSIWFMSDISKNKKKLCGKEIKCIDMYSRKITDIIKRNYYYFFASIIIDCNKCIGKYRDDQLRIYLTHGMPFKDPVDYMNKIGECDLLSVSGEGYIDYFSKYVNKDSIRFLGLPRNDLLFLRHKEENEKIIVWMPTFRQHNRNNENGITNEFALGIPIIKCCDEFNNLINYLESKHIIMFFRPHPAQDLSLIKIHNSYYFRILDNKYLEDNNLQLYEFLSKTSALITDYSSVYNDYLLTEKPIGLTFEDIDVYQKKWKIFYKNPYKSIPGNKINNINDLYNFIDEVYEEKDIYFDGRMKFMKLWGIKKINSCEMITNYIIEYLSNK